MQDMNRALKVGDRFEIKNPAEPDYHGNGIFNIIELKVKSALYQRESDKGIFKEKIATLEFYLNLNDMFKYLN